MPSSRLFSRHSLGRDLTIVTAIKILAIVLAGIFLFGADHRLRIDADVVAHTLFDQTSTSREK